MQTDRGHFVLIRGMVYIYIYTSHRSQLSRSRLIPFSSYGDAVASGCGHHIPMETSACQQSFGQQKFLLTPIFADMLTVSRSASWPQAGHVGGLCG